MNLDARKRLSEIIQAARGEESQRAFAKRIGLSYAAVRSWEKCENFPDLENLQALSIGIGIPVEKLVLLTLGKSVKLEAPAVAEDVFGIATLLPKREIARLIELLAKKLSQEMTD